MSELTTPLYARWYDAWATAYKCRAYGYWNAMPLREHAKMTKAWKRKELAADREARLDALKP